MKFSKFGKLMLWVVGVSTLIGFWFGFVTHILNVFIG